jgi:molybdopterin-containing oxidoreductase family iron-sulfur binding subunit
MITPPKPTETTNLGPSPASSGLSSTQWTSYDDLAAQEAHAFAAPSALSENDQLELSPEVEMSGLSRRTFLGVMGSSAALAGVGLSGCIRKPVTKLVPYATRPEDIVEGKPLYFATAYQEGANVLGVVVESHTGRPTKIEGNKLHPESLGATNTTAQASVLSLYDLDRSVTPTGKDGAALPWDKALAELDGLATAAKAGKAAFVLPAVMSPTYRRLIAEALASWPNARFYRADALWPAAAMAAGELVAGPQAYAHTNLSGADLVASFDCDFLGTETSAVRHTKAFSAKRRVEKPGDAMNRLYAVEPLFSITGSMADHRLRAKAGDVGKVLVAVAKALGGLGVTVASVSSAPAGDLGEKANAFVNALAKDLVAQRGKAVVVVGYRQPAWVHALSYAINTALSANDSQLQTWHRDSSLPPMGDLVALANDLKGGQLTHVFALDCNPAFTSPGELGLTELLKASTLVHAGQHRDETGAIATLHLPTSHYLECWGDLASLGGAVAIQQPLIEPLHHTASALELFARITTGKNDNGYDLVRKTWQSTAGFSEIAWEKWLHDGLVKVEAPPAAGPDHTKATELIAKGAAVPTAATEVVFALDPNILDGRHANNGWLREVPDPMTKVAWDNPALVNKKTANGLKTGDNVTVTAKGQTTLPLHLTPGLADGVVVVYVGHGRAAEGSGRIALQHGYAGWSVAPAALTDGWFTDGSFAAASGSTLLANVQPSGNQLAPRAVEGFGQPASPSAYNSGKGPNAFEPRMIAFQATMEEWKADPTFPDRINDRVMDDKKVKSWLYPSRPGEKPLAGGATTDDVYLNGVHQWAMSIDLNACTGCNACMIACQAENNIPVVGKDQVANGREMHWIRLDRYYSGSEDDPQAILQPLPCQQCETAPCEAVCPVKATAHSNEGLNDMAYNRCIGTRYCSNNCPFKVRRFNWFNFNEGLHPLEQMQKNPDVTVRFRGVMEKCTYCVQRINRAKIDAKISGDGRVKDGDIVTACQQVCPADAIVFGDLKDESSKVVKAKQQGRDFQLLRELNLRARTTYLAKLRNPNPDLV